MATEAPGTSGKGKVRLQPLKGVEAGPDINPTLPVIASITPTQGGYPVQAEPGIVSVPEGVGVRPSKTEAGIISVPGVEDPVGVGHAKGQGRYPQKVTPLEIMVYFEDKTGIDLSVEDGQHADAGELFEYIMEEMTFPAVARDVFSLWLVSDLLELQLKPNQIPFKLVFFWEELLEKYTNASDEDIERDEPVLVFRRNVFCSRVKDMKIEDTSLLRLLYAEAKENIIDARYPISQEDCDMLAGIQALIDHTVYIRDEHTPEYYRSKLSDYYPEHFCKRKMKFFRRHTANPENRLAESHSKAATKYSVAIADEEKKVCYKAYLNYCWKLPYYGAAFFRGQIEHPARKMRLMNLTDDPVFIAINTEGVFVIDMDDVEFLMGLIYEQLKWEFAMPKNPDDRNCMPCLFLQFSAEEDNKTCTKMLQVFSRQGVLMDGLINACIKLKRQSKAEDQLDGCQLDTVDGKQDGIIKAGGETWMKFNRLCLTTFDCRGNRLKTSARVPKGH